MERRRAPRTEEGWYVLHDFRSVDWDAWRNTPERHRTRAVNEGANYIRACEALSLTGKEDEGASAAFEIIGHKADLLFLHLRPTPEALSTLERQFERTELAAVTDRVDSYLSVTEVSGYMSEEYFEDDAAVEDSGIARYIDSRLHPAIPDAAYVSFYPMNKRRDSEWNWYDLPFDERAEYMSAHGDIGREYAGRVSQIISGSVGFDDYEWGITLFADDPTDIKELLYEMRFDPSSSRFGEFGRFLFGRRLTPAALDTYLTEDLVSQPTADDAGETQRGERHHDGSTHDHGTAHDHGSKAAEPDTATESPSSQAGGDTDLQGELADMGVYAGKPHGEDVHAVVLYSDADLDTLYEEVDGLRTNFDHYDSHVKTEVYEPRERADETAVQAAVASLWDTARAANTAAGFLAELPGVVRQAGDDGDDSWGTMGMFYTVESNSRGAFVDRFDDVAEAVEGMDGHRQTDLLINHEDECDMFIASRWDAREDAMAFFRSDAFADTVEWGRDILVDRPRHVFLA